MSLYENKTNLKTILKLSQSRIPTPEAYSKPYQTFMMELFAKIVNNFDVWQDSEYASELFSPIIT